MPKDDTIFLPVPICCDEKMSKKELYEAVRGDWNVDYGRRRDIKYAVAVINRLVKKVYKVKGWEGASHGKQKFRGVVMEEHNDLIGLSTPERSYGTIYYGDFSKLVSLKKRTKTKRTKIDR